MQIYDALGVEMVAGTPVAIVDLWLQYRSWADIRSSFHLQSPGDAETWQDLRSFQRCLRFEERLLPLLAVASENPSSVAKSPLMQYALAVVPLLHACICLQA
jgi:hypothetical protein